MNLYPTGFRFLSLVLVLLFCLAPIGVSAQSGDPTPEVTPQDLINLMNSLRTQSGYGPLIVDPILMRTAQETADIMALNQAGGHIGDVRGRVSAAGYGAGDIPWATENFAVGPSTIDRIQQVWADPDHMRPAVNPNYEHIGAGVAEYNGRVYYIVHAAYTSNSVYQPGGAGNTDSSGTTEDPGTAVGGGISQVIYPVETSTPQADGTVIHTVRQGQSPWAIAIAYGTKIIAIAAANNLYPQDNPTLYEGQTLIIPVTPAPSEAGQVTATQTTNSTDSSAAVPTLQTPSLAAATRTTVAARVTRTVQSAAAQTATPNPTPEDETPTAPNTADRIIQIGLMAAAIIGLGLILWGTLSRRSQ
jgi:LysM repeat protein